MSPCAKIRTPGPRTPWTCPPDHARRLLVPANIRHNSGGNVYNARLAQGLGALGVEVEVLAVDGSWPDASAKERRRLGSFLGAWGPGSGNHLKRVSPFVDGLIACGAPDEVEYAAAAGHPAWVLLHMPSPSHPDGERRALRAAAGVICTSSSAAAHVSERHGVPAPAGSPCRGPIPHLWQPVRSRHTSLRWLPCCPTSASC